MYKRGRGAKAKGKQPVPSADELAGEEALRLKAVLKSGSRLEDRELLRVLKADTPCEGLYAKACKGKSNKNPNCLCTLLPAPGGFRRQGLWAKETDVLGTLGADPATNKREDRRKPVGLKNLGNTCYVNSVLQCMFANQAFRRAVYALKQPLAEEPIVKQLRELFLAMEFGCVDPADPEPLAKSLNLDHGVQQDGQEFMKLFLNLLETKFGQQQELQDLIQTLYRGQSGYLTVCQRCNRQSESSARSDNFYEVDVPVKGHKSLQESLCSMLMPEGMYGDNQYMCEHCQCKVDATRQLQLRSLPPMLCFSLQRFVFDFQKMDRVKVSDKFAFPLTLNMAPIVDQPERTDLVYDLEAIMVHKGGSATQGHYVAHIKLECSSSSSSGGQHGGGAETGSKPVGAPTDGGGGGKEGRKNGRKKANAAASGAAGVVGGDGVAAEAAAADGTAAANGTAGGSSSSGSSWWRFDDETVSELKRGPTSSGDHGGAVGKAAAGSGTGSGTAAGEGDGSKKRGRGSGGAGRGGGAAGRGRGGRGRGGGKGRGGGGKKKAAAGSDTSEERMSADSEAEESDMEMKAAMAASMTDAPPGAAGAAAAFEQEAAAAAARQQGAQPPLTQQQQQQGGAAQQQRQQQAEEIVSSNAYLLVYRQRGAALPLVPLDEQQQAALAAAEQQLTAEQQRGAAAYAGARQDLLDRQQQRQREVRGIVEAAVQLEQGDTGRFVATDWLTKWADSGVESGNEPVDNASLLCPHGKLDPAKIAAARRISTPAWEQLCSSCRGGPELSAADACPTCLAAHLDAIVAAEDTQEQRDTFLAVATAVEAGEGAAQELLSEYYVSHAWLSAWLKRGGRSMGSTGPTDAITCPCGNLAPEGLNKQARRVGIPANFWRFLQRSWQAACAQRRLQEQRRSRKSLGGAGGSGGVWEVPGSQQQQEQQEQQQQPQQGGSDTEVICLDSPTFASVEQQQREHQQQQQQQGAKEEDVVEVQEQQQQQQQPAPEAEVRRQRRGRGGEAAAVPAAAGKVESAPAVQQHAQQVQEQQQQAQQQQKDFGDVVMLDVDEPAAAGAGAGAGAALAAEGDDVISGSDVLLEFPADCGECPKCATSLAAASRALKGLQTRLAEEKQDLQHLLQPHPASLQAGGSYRLVPAAFMYQWRVYMQQAGRKSVASTTKAEVMQPPSLAEALLGVLCECHQGCSGGDDGSGGSSGDGGSSSGWMLGYPAPGVVNKRGRWGLADADGGDSGADGGGGDAPTAADPGSAGIYEVLPDSDWELLSMYYGQHADEDSSGGGRRKHRQQLGLGQQQAEQLEHLLQRGIVATLAVDSIPGPRAGSGGEQLGQPPADLVDGTAAAAAAAEVDAPAPAAAALPPPAGRPARGRVATLATAAAAAGGEGNSSDAELLDQAWTTGDEHNPYQLKRRKITRQGAVGCAYLETDPPLCHAAVAERQAVRRSARLTYTAAQVMVESVASVAEAAAAGEPAVGGVERKSRRARKGRAPVTLDSTHNLRDLRMRILEALDVHPLNAQLFLRGEPLVGEDEATLAECEVYPGDEIKVVDSGVHDGSDLASLFPLYGGGKGGRRPREAERGFTGTALTGLVPAAAAAAADEAAAAAAAQVGAPVAAEWGAVAAGGAAAAEPDAAGIDLDAELAVEAAAGGVGEMAD